MKVESKREVPQGFRPITMTVTLETRREAVLFRAIVGNPGSHSEAAARSASVCDDVEKGYTKEEARALLDKLAAGVSNSIYRERS